MLQIRMIHIGELARLRGCSEGAGPQISVHSLRPAVASRVQCASAVRAAFDCAGIGRLEGRLPIGKRSRPAHFLEHGPGFAPPPAPAAQTRHRLPSGINALPYPSVEEEEPQTSRKPDASSRAFRNRRQLESHDGFQTPEQTQRA
jgi:hypothetical protein